MKQFSRNYKTNMKKSITSFYTGNNQRENNIEKKSHLQEKKRKH